MRAALVTTRQGTLYGTTEVGGVNNAVTVFSLNPQTGAETVLHSFHDDGNDGAYACMRQNCRTPYTNRW